MLLLKKSFTNLNRTAPAYIWSLIFQGLVLRKFMSMWYFYLQIWICGESFKLVISFFFIYLFIFKKFHSVNQASLQLVFFIP